MMMRMVFYLNLRPNMVICESGTGFRALSHCSMRRSAPKGMLLHSSTTYEFNQQGRETAKVEFTKNCVSHLLVPVNHKDVCGKHGLGGFDQVQASAKAFCFRSTQEAMVGSSICWVVVVFSKT
jgi:tRNA A58 N-methylase Trm61